jgi:hypothetical protein
MRRDRYQGREADIPAEGLYHHFWVIGTAAERQVYWQWDFTTISE